MYLREKRFSQVPLMPVILVTQDAKIRRIEV
jgi:hypothetical protein